VIYSLDPPDENPGWWDEVVLKDLIDPGRDDGYAKAKSCKFKRLEFKPLKLTGR